MIASVKILDVTRKGDAGFARVEFTRGETRSWATLELCTEWDGVTPRPYPVDHDSSRGLAVAVAGLVERERRSLFYWIDSLAHFWCADNNRSLYGS